MRISACLVRRIHGFLHTQAGFRRPPIMYCRKASPGLSSGLKDFQRSSPPTAVRSRVIPPFGVAALLLEGLRRRSVFGGMPRPGGPGEVGPLPGTSITRPCGLLYRQHRSRGLGADGNTVALADG